MLLFLDNLRKKTKLRVLIVFFGYFYLSLWNHIFNKIPVYWLRYFIVKYFYGLKIGKSNIHYGVKFLSPWNVSIGDNSNIQMDCFIDGRGEVKIGNNVDINMGVAIFSEQHDINDPEYAAVKKKVEIHSNSTIGSFSLILPGVVVGEGGVIGAGSVVVKDVSEYSMVAGNPAVKKRDRSNNINYNVSYKRPFH